MLKSFQEDDIKDIFSNFVDRYKVRQYITSKTGDHMGTHTSKTEVSMTRPQCHDVESDIETSSQESDLDVSTKALPKYSSHVPSPQKPCAATYSVDDMLEKKVQRKVPTREQSFFHNLIRDSAETANIWKKALPLAQISDSKKNMFLESVFRTAPQLKPKRRIIWQRLGQCLQNRRKYLRDKQAGKRVKVSQTRKPSEPDTLKLGDKVTLLDRSHRCKLGEGILVNNQNDMFVEVVVNAVNTANMKVDEADLELPVPVSTVGGTINKLSNEIVKSVISWWRNRLAAHTGKRSNVESVPSTIINEKTVQERAGTSQEKVKQKPAKKQKRSDVKLVSSTIINETRRL